MISKLRASGTLGDLSVAFNAATALFALPLYVPLHASPGLIELAGLVFFVQILPTAAAIAIGRALAAKAGRGFVWRGYWIALTLAGAASFLRLWQLHAGVGLPDSPAWTKIAVLAAIGPVVLVMTLVRADWLPRIFGRVAPVTAVVCAAFLVSIQLNVQVSGSAKIATLDARDDAAFIFIFDELGRHVLERDGKIDAVRFPNLAALADESTWVTDATSNYSASCQSIPSMLSGRLHPECDESFLMGGQATLLTTLATGYRLQVYEDYFRGCPNGAEVCRSMPYLIAHYPLAGIANHLLPQSVRVGPLLDVVRGRDANPYTLALWTDFMEQVSTSDLRGRAFFLHINLPHAPYAYRADGTLSRAPSRSQYFYGTEQDTFAYENYREQIRFVDALFGSFVRVLQQRNAYAAATIVVTGDHGPRLQVPPKTTKLVGVAAETPGVPLIVKSPRFGQSGRTSEYQHIDFAPTVLDAVGMPAEGFDGRSALEPGVLPREKTFITGGALFVRQSDGTWLEQISSPYRPWLR